MRFCCPRGLWLEKDSRVKCNAIVLAVSCSVFLVLKHVPTCCKSCPWPGSC